MAHPENATDFRPRSLLDTDLYKLTMQQAVLQHFPKTNVTYRFTNRSKEMLFSRGCFELVKQSVSRLSELQLTEKEAEWLKTRCPYFTENYLDYLRSYRFQPDEQVKMELQVTSEPGADVEEGHITIDISGLWVETILYEVPVMSILSEAYFLTVDRGWTYENQEEIAYQKAKHLIQAGVAFSDFVGKRLRADSRAQPHFAMKYDLSAMGTIAHEWIMAIAAIRGYENANGLAMDLWEATYPTTESNILHIALTGIKRSRLTYLICFKTDTARAERWRGLRQDSGDPFEFIPKVRAAYESMGIDYRKKVIVFSDGLDVELAVKLQQAVDQAGFIGAFGIGTFLTNDYKRTDNGERSKPLNMVIKIASVEGKPCVKISDDITKNTGDPAVVAQIKQKFGIAA
ncbi:hypothetical protein RSAG8_02579, partial [Rhizoctonia solani AG-8 WAC10335]